MGNKSPPQSPQSSPPALKSLSSPLGWTGAGSGGAGVAGGRAYKVRGTQGLYRVRVPGRCGVPYAQVITTSSSPPPPHSIQPLGLNPLSPRYRCKSPAPTLISPPAPGGIQTDHTPAECLSWPVPTPQGLPPQTCSPGSVSRCHVGDPHPRREALRWRVPGGASSGGVSHTPARAEMRTPKCVGWRRVQEHPQDPGGGGSPRLGHGKSKTDRLPETCTCRDAGGAWGGLVGAPRGPFP